MFLLHLGQHLPVQSILPQRLVVLCLVASLSGILISGSSHCWLGFKGGRRRRAFKSVPLMALLSRYLGDWIGKSGDRSSIRPKSDVKTEIKLSQLCSNLDSNTCIFEDCWRQSVTEEEQREI